MEDKFYYLLLDAASRGIITFQERDTLIRHALCLYDEALLKASMPATGLSSEVLSLMLARPVESSEDVSDSTENGFRLRSVDSGKKTGVFNDSLTDPGGQKAFLPFEVKDHSLTVCFQAFVVAIGQRLKNFSLFIHQLNPFHTK